MSPLNCLYLSVCALKKPLFFSFNPLILVGLKQNERERRKVAMIRLEAEKSKAVLSLVGANKPLTQRLLSKQQHKWILSDQ